MGTTSKRAPGPQGRDVVDAALLDEVLAATRVLVAISAESIASIEDRADLVQVRVLVAVASRGVATLREVAASTGLHMSKASRTCDRMVAAGLLERTANAVDRRHLDLRVSPSGAAIVRGVVSRRRTALRPILAAMTPSRRRRLMLALRDFNEIAGEPSDIRLWSMGWTTPSATRRQED